MKRPRVLVTGFGPFPGVRVNPSAALARRLARSGRLKRAGVDIAAAEFRTAYDDVDVSLPPLLKRADIVLMLGVAARRKWLSVEQRGVNHASRTAPDAGGNAAPPSPRGAHIRTSRAPLAVCLAALRKARLPARRSIDAGRYLCNASYYQGLARAPAAATVLFVHVPMPAPSAGTQRRRGNRSMPDLDAMERGLSDIVLTLMRAARLALSSRAREG
jgi:pyroglutamyl-peptidase